MTQPKKAISLFSGAGGDTLGLTQAGYEVVAFSENNAAAITTHHLHFPESTLLRDPATGSTDIRKIPDAVFAAYTGQIDLVFGGAPCQGFSHAGKKRADDPRNELVHEMARVLRIVRPRWMIFENVRGLLSRKGYDPAEDLPTLKPVMEILRRVFSDAGYKITASVVDVTAVGVPQLRKRLLAVGYRSSHWYPHLRWPSLSSATLPATRALLEPTLEGAVLLANAAPSPHFLIPTTETEATGTPHPNLLRLDAGLRNRSTKERDANPLAPKTLTEPDGLLSFGSRKSSYHGEIIDPDKPCKTIICTYQLCPRLFVGLQGTDGHRWVRCLTIRELAQIQGFPVDYTFCGEPKAQITQIGNAVPPPLATAIVDALRSVVCRPYPQAVSGAGAGAGAGAADSDEETAE